MDRLLKPERFTTEPNEPEAEKRYKHWKATLQNYFASTLHLLILSFLIFVPHSSQRGISTISRQEDGHHIR